MDKRLQSIDLLRGIAIILVIFCHSRLDFIGAQMGWSGVDLFFVLSGFLVSGLLFNEYKKDQKVHVGLFLVRRGFKIYPLFWFTLLLYLVIDYIAINYLQAYTHSFSWCPSCYVHELLFIQNYFPGRAYITWSLAIEEHFYLLLSFFIWVMVAKKALTNKPAFIVICIAVLLLCNILRIASFNSGETSPYKLSFPTHLRIDSLLSGALISYFYHFSRQKLTYVIHRYKLLWILVMIACFTAVTTWQYTANMKYLYTVGFTLLYAGYGLALLLLLTTENIEVKLQKVLTKPLLALLATIGYYSYSIYLFHIMIANIFMPALRTFVSFPLYFIEFLVYFIVSILSGIYISRLVEIPFLKLRDRFFPKRNQQPV